ncbi:hypothetical protein VVD49_18525 [Uliginosibacterium sp. H3]|uniref:Uncharacterized protein n=1 Tax=Uliginosibacterium silvisoli TaxID=3114758 RepID=A0ABU6K9U6_9RHOO|nr:hypothetical protein [Uliginosibacterium sp. H3]
MNGSYNSYAEEINSRLAGKGKFEFVTALRLQATARVNQETLNLIEEPQEDLAKFQHQFEAIDKALVHALTVEGRINSYTQWTRSTDPDLPVDPQAFLDPRVSYKYALMRLYRRQFETTVNERKSGCWPLIEFDLLAPLDGKRLLMVEVFHEAVTSHPSSDFVARIPIERLQEIQATYASVAEEVQLRARTGQAGAVGSAFRIIHEAIDAYYCQANDALRDLCAERDRIQRAEREAREAKERAAVKEYHDRFGREPREVPGASDHVDHFDRNHDRIGRTC